MSDIREVAAAVDGEYRDPLETRTAGAQLDISMSSESQTIITAAAYLGDIPVVIALGDAEIVLR